MSLLLTSKEVMDEVSTALYEQQTFEVLLDDTSITFMNKKSAHILPRDELGDRPEDRFGALQLFGFSRIRHLRLTIDTMFPQAGDACTTNDERYDLAMYGTVQHMVFILCADHLHLDQKGLQTLGIKFLSNHLKPDQAGRICPSKPRGSQFMYASETDLALDFVLRPLTKLRWVDRVIFKMPKYWDHDAYQYGNVLKRWCDGLKEQVCDATPSARTPKRIAFDAHLVGDVNIAPLMEMTDLHNIRKRYHERYAPVPKINSGVEEDIELDFNFDC